MNKSHSTARSATRARSSVAAARMRQTFLELDENDEPADLRDGQQLAPILDEDDDWIGTETEADINYLLHGYR